MKKTNHTTPFAKFRESEAQSSDEWNTFVGASTHPARIQMQLEDGSYTSGEILSYDVLKEYEKNINDSTVSGGDYGSFRTVSLFHDRVLLNDSKLEEAGYIKVGSAKVIEDPESKGNYLLLVDAKPNKMFKPPQHAPDYTSEKIQYKIDENALGLSIEYGNQPEHAKIVNVDGKKYNYITKSEDFRGFGWARVNVIADTHAIKIREIDIRSQRREDDGKTKDLNNSKPNKKNIGDTLMADNENNDPAKAGNEDAAKKISETQAKVRELTDELAKVRELAEKGSEQKIAEMSKTIEETNTKLREMKLENDKTAAKIRETLTTAFDGLKFTQPSETPTEKTNPKVREAYAAIEQKNYVKIRDVSQEFMEKNAEKIREMLSLDGPGFSFEKHQTLKVRCVGSQMIVVPTAKTRDVLNTDGMAEGTYSQTNAMFADQYVPGITETFLKDDSLLLVLNKEAFAGGNDNYQWRIWTEYDAVTGDNTAAVDPNTTSVATNQDKFEKMQTRICEYRKGVEVTDFTQAHSVGAGFNLLDQQIMRKAQFITNSMNADLYKPKTDATAGWLGFIGLIGYADSSTYSTIYGKVRSATNRLLDSTLANTYVSTSEGISVELMRDSYEKVLAHGSQLSDIVIPIHPTQVRRLFNSEDAAIRNQILTMSGAPASFGFNRAIIPHIDGIPMIRDYYCESSAAAKDMFAVVDLSADKGLNLIVSKPLGVRGLAKVGTSEKVYVSFWGCTAYKSPRNVFVHTGLIAT